MLTPPANAPADWQRTGKVMQGMKMGTIVARRRRLYDVAGVDIQETPAARKHAPRSIWESHEYGHGNGTFHPQTTFAYYRKAVRKPTAKKLWKSESKTVGRGYSDQHNRCPALTAQQAHESDGYHSLGRLDHPLFYNTHPVTF